MKAATQPLAAQDLTTAPYDVIVNQVLELSLNVVARGSQ